jgi:hypothetical protein
MKTFEPEQDTKRELPDMTVSKVYKSGWLGIAVIFHCRFQKGEIWDAVWTMIYLLTLSRERKGGRRELIPFTSAGAVGSTSSAGVDECIYTGGGIGRYSLLHVNSGKPSIRISDHQPLKNEPKLTHHGTF